jgi:CRISPR-associated exonuclease Cas4
VEYKRGKPRANACDEVQLCAQAICLEEMLGVAIGKGALFYGTNRRRTEVPFSETLRRGTEALAARMHELYAARATPPGAHEKKCDSCSLLLLFM